MDEFDLHKKVGDEIMPEVRALLRKIGKWPKLAMSGFIYGYVTDEPDAEPFLMRIGNIQNTGQDFIDIHVGLAIMSAQLHEQGAFDQESFSQKPAAGENESTEKLADKLAITLLSTPLEMLPEPVSAALQVYLDARRQGS